MASYREIQSLLDRLAIAYPSFHSQNILVHRPNYTDGWNDKETSIRIIVHETSHMWFGDSVTFAWWNNFWLNEAFARYYEYFMSHQVNLFKY